ncbi:NfeD family protein [Desulfonema ishimotonii]|uniref:NfeD family protein n=1 Tax=Desulfonema ishimotonii TaxID=45657 RepID=A0A401FW46_9BACT|nr:NfeD family protein [Desulfonema ishimotonii]GBC61181.1 NfeD family protein [Desulfonema ishimotonii]
MGWESLRDPTLIWFFIGLFCVIAEFALPGLIIFFFGIGAWIVSLLTWVTDISVFFQVSVFIVTSVSALITLRKKLNPLQPDHPDVTDDFKGKIVVVCEPVSKGKPGCVTFKGSRWKAETLSAQVLKEGQRVRILGHESIVLHVEPLEEEEE